MPQKRISIYTSRSFGLHREIVVKASEDVALAADTLSIIQTIPMLPGCSDRQERPLNKNDHG